MCVFFFFGCLLLLYARLFILHNFLITDDLQRYDHKWINEFFLSFFFGRTLTHTLFRIFFHFDDLLHYTQHTFHHHHHQMQIRPPRWPSQLNFHINTLCFLSFNLNGCRCYCWYCCRRRADTYISHLQIHGEKNEIITQQSRLIKCFFVFAVFFCKDVRVEHNVIGSSQTQLIRTNRLYLIKNPPRNVLTRSERCQRNE